MDNKLVDLERSPDDRGLLNDIFRGFHTIKGGAGFLNAGELVTLCHLTENLFDRLRNGELSVTAESMDIILAATAAVRDMFGDLERGVMPHAADGALIASLQGAIQGVAPLSAAATPAPPAVATKVAAGSPQVTSAGAGPDWQLLMSAVTGARAPSTAAVQAALPPAEPELARRRSSAPHWGVAPPTGPASAGRPAGASRNACGTTPSASTPRASTRC